MMRVTIRPATPDDAVALHAAIRAMGEHLGLSRKIKSTPADLARHGLAPGRAFEGLIAEIGGEFAGMCLFFPSFSTWLGCPGVYIQDLYVEPRFREQGIGERLIRRAAAQACDRGAAYLRLAVDADNLAAQGFYERLGITRYEADRIHAAYGEAFQALVAGGKNDQGTT